MNDRSSPDKPLATRTEVEGATVDLPEGLGFFTTGQVLGDRYEILEMLGRGGMGEVWRAFDLKLRVEVGLKALREELFKSERRLELLRQEVRAAREVVSPNVCRIFDLIEIDGRELVSMEYVDGATLLAVLQERGPLDLKQAQDIASQFLAGLEAIHKAGLVHRDVKPENIMLTRAGRVVVMDFGLAREPESGAGSVSGTPAYMAPEHAAGSDVDARADVYSAGVVLAEMVSPDGVKSYESRQSVWEGVRSEPAKVPDSPWAPVIKRAVARDRERRQHSAHTLIRELEDVTLRVEGAEDLHPYPGLASFTEEDAEYFFGREAEIESVWRRLESAHLLAIVGASGAGKTSFIGAGLHPNAPPGWQIARCTPGNAAVSSLRRMLIHELTGDAEALELLVDSDSLDSIVKAATRWRRVHNQALLVIDQFEELFTQNPPEEQARFATLVGRLVVEADVRVLLSMRDDFLLHCNRHEALRPLFATLTPLDPPAGAALRRAVIQPALKCGYRYEDDALVEEILSEVEGERGALPMLAFAASRLWEKRDRESGLLTRQAYHDIGGVGGALARHAEATVDRIGIERIPIVRELFRNLVTAEGTRAVREWDELLSVFDGESREGVNPSPTKAAGDAKIGADSARPRPSGTDKPIVGAGFIPARDAAAEVLGELIDARLLTSYEVREDEHEPIRRVEIIHESLLANWPRLVRWQTQDADAVQVREQLRQAARTWDDQGRTDDTLWTGSAYREFALWRESYPGGLTGNEEAFATAMTSLATRRKRRRRVAAVAAVIIVTIVAAVFAGLWRRSVEETRRAEAATKRAEAQKLLALGEIQLEVNPTEAFAWARASLEVSDTREGRIFAVRALSRGPMARVIKMGGELGIAHDAIFSPDGEWIGLRGNEQLNVYHRSGGGPAFTDTFSAEGGGSIWPFFDPSHNRLGAYRAGEIRTYSVPDFAETARHQVEIPNGYPFPTDRGVFFIASLESNGRIKRWRPGSPPELVTTIPPLGPRFLFKARIGTEGEWVAYVPEDENRHVYLRSLIDPTLPARPVHIHDTAISNLVLLSKMGLIAVRGQDSPAITVWPLDENVGTPLRTFPGRGLAWTSNDDRRIIESGIVDGNPTAFVWDLKMPAGSEPIALRWRGGSENIDGVSIDPTGRWATAGTLGRVPIWSLPANPTITLSVYDGNIHNLEFTPDGKALVITDFALNSGEGGVYLQPVVGGEPGRRLLDGGGAVAIDPQGRFAVVSAGPGAIVCPLDGSDPTWLGGLPQGSWAGAVAYHPERELVATGVFGGSTEKVIGVWSLQDGTMQVLGPADDAGEAFWGGYHGLEFLRDGSLISHTREKLVRRWNLEDGSSEVLFAENHALIGVKPDGQTAVIGGIGSDGSGELTTINFTTNETRRLEGSWKIPSQTSAATLSAQGDAIAVGFDDGTIRVQRLEGGEPYVLFGGEAPVLSLAFSPDGSLLASGGQDGTVRIWQAPDLSKPPLQTLPHDELLAKLDTFTNLRVVRNEATPTGWKVELGPFPGWETVPEW